MKIKAQHTYKNLRHTARAECGCTCVSPNSNIRKEERPQSIALRCYLKKREKEEHVKPKLRRREIIKIKAEISKIENRNMTMKIKETKSWFLEKNQ